MISRKAVLVSASLIATTLVAPPALADIPAYKSCMSKTLRQFGGSAIFFNLKGLKEAVDARAACKGHLTPEEAAQVYEEGKGFWDLYRDGGPLDPTSRGYFQRI